MKPLILDYKESRLESNATVMYSYDPTLCMNTSQIDGEEIAFIDIGTADLQLATKTKVHPEADDERNLLELHTKTRVKAESDDDRYLNELNTKTFVAAERDDEKPARLH